MARVRGPLVLALALLVWLSGCAGLDRGGEEVPTISLPPLRFGDEWTTVHHRDAKLVPGETVRIGNEVETVPDRFGVPTQAVNFDRAYAGEWTARAWVETRGGNWLVTGEHPTEYRTACVYPVTPTSYGSISRNVVDASMWHVWGPARADLGEVWGKTFGPAVVRETGSYPLHSPDLESVVNSEYKVLGTATISPPVGAGHPMEAVVVEYTASGFFGSPDGNHRWEMKFHLFLHEGFPVPLRTQLVDGSEVRVVSELKTYKPGGKPIPFGDEARPAAFAKQNPSAVFSTAKVAPPLGDLKLEFPFDAALAAARTEPRTSAWLLLHPNHWSPSASYMRDSVRGVYQWEIVLRDGQDMVQFTAQRRTSILPVQDSASAASHSSYSPHAMPPREPTSDLGSALRVSQGFDEALHAWRQLSWTVVPGDETQTDWHWDYGFATARTTARPGPAPYVETEVVEYESGPRIDGPTGGREVGSWPLKCKSTLVARPPV